jgi:transposase InsO family protein
MYLVILFLSVILPMLLLSSKLKRNLIIAQNLTRLDNEGEYTSNKFGIFCRDVGIKRKLTTPYNPQKNGLAERKNITIMESIKTMIHDQDLLMHLWDEVVRTIVYVQNRLSHSELGFKTPQKNVHRKES